MYIHIHVPHVYMYMYMYTSAYDICNIFDIFYAYLYTWYVYFKYEIHRWN